MKRIVMMAFIISLGNKSYAQLNEDNFLFDYVLAPIGGDDVDYNKTGFKVNIPITFKNSKLINSLGFDNYNFSYTKDVVFFTDDVSEIFNLNYGLKYILPITKTWLLTTNAKVAIVANSIKSVSNNDLLLTGDMQFTKIFGTESENQKLSFGLSYTTITGKPKLLPIFSYFKKVNENFSYSIGYPEAYADYKINDLSSIKSVFLVDGFYANINDTLIINTTAKAEKIAFSSTSLGLEYLYKMDDYWGVSAKGGYALSNTYQLLNNDDAEVFDFNTTAKPFFSVGVTFNLKTQNKK